MYGFFLSLFLSVFICVPVVFSSDISFKRDKITVGSCQLDVLVAETPEEKASGMLGFTDNTFPTEGMIFLGDTEGKHYYHTMGMLMDIRIMGINKVGDKKYQVVGGAIYSPKGKRSIQVYGESVFEVSERLYQKSLINCLFSKDINDGK